MLAHSSVKTLASTVLKIGHHGSKTSTSAAFLQAVDPQWAAISVGRNNDYGLPSDKTLELLKQQGVTYWRTDEVGSIVFYSDGHTVTRGDEQTMGSTADVQPHEQSEQPTAGAAASVSITSVDRVAEVAVLTNTGSEAVDLSGWILVSVKGDQRYTFPEGTRLAAGQALEVISGEGAEAKDGQLLWAAKNIWNNTYDPAELYDESGDLIAEFGK